MLRSNCSFVLSRRALQGDRSKMPDTCVDSVGGLCVHEICDTMWPDIVSKVVVGYLRSPRECTYACL